MRYTLVGAGALLTLFGVFVLVAPVLTRLGKNRNRMTADEVADAIERFIERRGGPYDWDDFISVPIYDDDLDAIRLRCAGLSDEFPASGAYCSEEGYAVLDELVRQLRTASQAAQPTLPTIEDGHAAPTSE